MIDYYGKFAQCKLAYARVPLYPATLRCMHVVMLQVACVCQHFHALLCCSSLRNLHFIRQHVYALAPC